MKKIILSVFCLSCFFNGIVWADTIILEDGEIITGKIIKQNDNFISIQTENNIQQINKDYIKRLISETPIVEVPSLLPKKNENIKSESKEVSNYQYNNSFNRVPEAEILKKEPMGFFVYPGVANPLTKYASTSEKISKRGFMSGVQILRQRNSKMNFGIDINYQNFSKNEFQTDKGEWASETSSLNISLIWKTAFIRNQRYVGNIFGGFGLSYFTMLEIGKPGNGYVWIDTGTTERRTITDDTSIGLNVFLGGEIVSYMENDRFMVIGAKYLRTSVSIDSYDEFVMASINYYIGIGQKFAIN
jgi:hypothetical protein